MNEEIKLKLNLINDELKNISNNLIPNNISNLLDEIIDEIKYFKSISKEIITNDDIKIISQYKKNKSFIKNIFPIFHYLYELELNKDNI